MKRGLFDEVKNLLNKLSSKYESQDILDEAQKWLKKISIELDYYSKITQFVTLSPSPLSLSLTHQRIHSTLIFTPLSCKLQ